MKKKKKKISKLFTVAATATVAVSSFGTAGSVLATSTDQTTTVKDETKNQATISPFTLYNNADLLNAYNKAFKIDNNKISVTNNAGHYSSSSLSNMFDGNQNTHWETNKQNSESFTNELTFTFDEVVTLNRIVYAPRVTGSAGKGFPLEFEIQGKSTDDGEYKVVATGSYSDKNSAIQIQFESTEFKELKFVFKNAEQGWAAASEMMFFKQDTVSEKIDRLFVNDELTIVSDEFKAEGALEALEQEVSKHPLNEQFMKHVEDAKSVLAMEEITSSEAETKAFKHYDNADYKEEFMVPLTNIESIENNGRHYSNQVINNAVDGNLSTYWETNTGNTDSFKNTIEVEFKEAVDINRLVYGARPDKKGFANTFDIYVSPTSYGDTYQLVSNGSYNTVDGLVEAKFDTTKAKRVKFVINTSNQNWATLSELAFFTEDKVSDKVEELFIDGTQSAVVTEYNSLAKITELENEAKTHLLYDDLKDDLELAKKIVKGELNTEGTIVTAEQVGNRKGYASNVLRSDIGSNLQPTGLAVKAGKEITVYVEANGATNLPTMVFSQQEGSWASWSKSVQLSPGKNVIEVPEVSQSSYYNYEVTSGGMIYIVNPYTAEEQGEAPVIRIEGAERVPYMTKDTDPEEFKTFLTEYKAKVDADIVANPNVADREVLDVVEIVSDHVIYTGTATEAYKAYITEDKDPKATVDGYDVWMQQIFDYHGLSESNTDYTVDNVRESIRLMQPWGFMYAASDHTGIQGGSEGLMFGDFRVEYPGWGLNHEIGHRIDIGAREYVEVTNNMTAMAMSVKSGNTENRIPFENTIYKYVIGENKVDWTSQDLASRLGTFWQLELAHDGYWSELENLYRKNQVNSSNDEQKQQNLIKYSSDVLKKDLSSHFARHGFTVTDETKEYTSKYEAPDKYWYLNNSVINYEGTGFTENLKVDIDVSSNESAKTNTLNFSINAEDKNNLLGYEILRDGEVIGFTSGSSLTIEDVDTTKAHEYQVVPYDKKLNTATEINVNSFKPTISVEDHLTIKLRDPIFKELDYVKAYDYKGNDITSAVKVKSSNVNLNKKGDYQVVYEVANQGITETKTLNVTVTSDFDYLSDLQAESYDIDWGGLKLDKSPQGGTITLLRDGRDVTYDKGLGAHANSEIVYDVADKGYDYFESYIGIDQAMKGNNSSATFEVWVDGEKKYTSGTFNAGSESEYVKVPITDAKQVKLITTDANQNNNSTDHTVWADAKFTKDSSKPVISVSSVATKVGEPIDIEYKATDAEDGDLTAAVKVTGVETIDFDTVGEYKILYTVTDNDGNEVTETRTVSVVDMNDFMYLSDYDWTSETHSYAAPYKDEATGGTNKLRLTNEDGEEVTYEKGIGAHSKSTITYDLTGKNVSYFSAYVGIDRQMYKSVGKVGFQVLVDGVEKFNSGDMASTDPQKYVEVNLSGAKTLTLVVTDGGNGNGSDHATWGDAKLHYADTGVTPEKTLVQIKDVVKEALTSEGIDLTTVEELYASNPKVGEFAGSESETKIVEAITEELQSVRGKYAVNLTNYKGLTNVDEIIKAGLIINYTTTDGETYTYSQGAIK